MRDQFYGYLNPESTKTNINPQIINARFYGYLNPESTKTKELIYNALKRFTVT